MIISLLCRSDCLPVYCGKWYPSACKYPAEICQKAAYLQPAPAMTGDHLLIVPIVLFPGRWYMANSKNSEKLYREGLSLLQDNRFEEAAATLRKALEANPDHAGTLDGLGIALTQMQQFPEALEKFTAALKLEPDNARILDNLGYSLFQKGEYQAALEKFIEAAQKDPSLNIAFVDWAAALVKVKAGEARIKKFFQATIAAHNTADAYRMLLDFADQLSDEGEYRRAVLAYKEAIHLEPQWDLAFQRWLQALSLHDYSEAELEDYRQEAIKSNLPEILRSLAVFLVSVNQFEPALSLYRQVENSYPNLPDLDFNIAQLHMEQQDYDAAAMRLKQALKRSPEDDQAQLLYGQCLARRGQYPDAISEYRAVIARDPQNVQAYQSWREAIANLPSADRQLLIYEKEVAANLKNADSFRDLGKLYLEKGQQKQAINWFKKALELNPHLWPAYTDWGKAISELPQQSRRQQIAAMEKKILDDHQNADGMNVLGNAYFALERYEEAIERYQRAVEDDPMYNYAYYNWGLSLLRLERFDEAIVQYRKAVEVNPDYALAYSGWGEALQAKKDYPAAIEKFEQAAALSPQNEEIYRNWGNAIRELEEPEAAVKKLETALYSQVTAAGPFLNYGVLLSDLKRYDDAIRQYRKSLTFDAGYALAYYNWGVALELKGNPREAVETYLKSLELDGTYENAYSNAGKQLLLLDQPDHLLEQFQQTVEKFDQARGYLELGNTMVELRRLEMAISSYKKVIEKDPENHWALRNWGMALSNQRKYQEAIRKFEESTRVKPDFGWGYLDWGIALDAIGEHEQAIAKYQQAIDSDPNDPYAHENCGIALSNLHRYEEAIKKYQDALRVRPNFISSRFRIGNAYLDLLRYDDAIEAYNQTMAAEPDYALSTYSSHNIAHIWERRAHFKIARKAWRETADLYEKHRNTAKNRRDAFHFLFYGGIYQFALDDPDKAEELYLAGLELDAGMVDIMINLLQIYLDRKNRALGRDDSAALTRNDAHWKAWEMYRRAGRMLEQQLKEGRSMVLLLQQAKLYRLVEHYDEAAEVLKECYKRDRENSDILIETGVLHMRQENPKEAIKSFQAALALDPDDLNLKSNLAEGHLKSGDKQKAESLYRDILAVSVDHLDSLMGLGEVYTAMGEDALQREARGDADEYFNQALHFYAEALDRHASHPDAASKKLSASEKSALFYAKGYTRVKLYESQRKKDDNELATAMDDFKRVQINTANYYKAQRAARKIDERLQKHRELSASWGPRVIFALALLIFLLAQVGFYIGKPVTGVVEAKLPHAPLGEVFPAGEADSLERALKSLAGKTFDSREALIAAVSEAGGEQAADAVRESSAFQKIGELEWKGLSPIDATAYGLLTFGALIFMVAGLYLQEISKLKFGAIELEKSSVDQISSSFSFGISRGSLGKTSG